MDTRHRFVPATTQRTLVYTFSLEVCFTQRPWLATKSLELVLLWLPHWCRDKASYWGRSRSPRNISLSPGFFTRVAPLNTITWLLPRAHWKGEPPCLYTSCIHVSKRGYMENSTRDRKIRKPPLRKESIKVRFLQWFRMEGDFEIAEQREQGAVNTTIMTFYWLNFSWNLF